MKIEKMANIAVILVAAVFIGNTFYDRVVPRVEPGPNPPERMMGKTLHLPSSVSTGTRVTVVLFVSPRCHFCTESMPFYTRLASLSARGSNFFRVLAITPEGAGWTEDGKKYFTDHGVRVDGVAQMQFSAVGVPATPTLALLDSSRRVVKAWTGKLPGDKEEDVIKAIENLCADCKGA